MRQLAKAIDTEAVGVVLRHVIAGTGSEFDGGTLAVPFVFGAASERRSTTGTSFLHTFTRMKMRVQR